jgi:hypothetical protein
MEKELFDKLMTKWGWIPKGNEPMELLATDNPDTDWKGIDTAYKYSHKAEMTICVDDEEISSIIESGFDDWLEEASMPYIDSRLYDFCKKNGKRYKTHEGEYIEVWFDNERGIDMQIERLTVQDDYVLQHKEKVFNVVRKEYVYDAKFFKSRPII